MARQKKKTDRRGRPPKNADAPKRKYTRRKVRSTATAIGTMGGIADAFGVPMEQMRSQAFYMALETRKISGGLMGGIDSLIEDANKIRKYLSDGMPEGSEPRQTAEADPNVGQVGILSPDNDPPYTIALRDAAE